MFYPIKFKPVYKNYIWGGRNLAEFGKQLPEGIVAESWEVSAHPDGISTVSNGRFEGLTLLQLMEKYGSQICCSSFSGFGRFPLLLKLIGANRDLSVQVHPDDDYARVNEGDSGKDEAWYIISAKTGASLLYDVNPCVEKQAFLKALKSGSLDSCLQKVPVKAGDVIYIPSGVIHAICSGIVLAEIQQSSNATYRVYDYNRTDSSGRSRPLHIEKALDVIDFNSKGRIPRFTGLDVDMGNGFVKRYLAAGRHFCMELYDVEGQVQEKTDEKRFYIYLVLEGKAAFEYSSEVCEAVKGESVLIPACLEDYIISGQFRALRFYVPDIVIDFIQPLENAGYRREEILKNVGGITTENFG